MIIGRNITESDPEAVLIDFSQALKRRLFFWDEPLLGFGVDSQSVRIEGG